MRTPSFLPVFLLAASIPACSGAPLSTPDEPPGVETPSSASRSIAVSACPTYPDSEELTRACIVDSNGKTYRQDGTMYVLPAAPPYGAMFVFKPGFVPLQADIADPEGIQAGIKAYAAPYDVKSSTTCCSEDSEANRIPVAVTLDETGVLRIAANAPVPSGYQIAIILDFAALYRGRLSTANGTCDLPDATLCSAGVHMGFAVRFYVGAAPGLPAATPDAAVPAADGACLLSYNTALADGDPCCYRKGGANTCNKAIACNERSGGGCCLIYGTENTAGGGRCCLYATGGRVDGAAECAALLATK